MRSPLRRDLHGWTFVLPWLIALVVFIGYPFAWSMYLSTCDYAPLRMPLYVGADNYRELAGDPLFQRSLGVTLLYGAVAIPLGVALAVTLSMLLNARIRGQSFYRVVAYLPHLVPTVVVALLWMWIFNPQYGLLNMMLRTLFAAVDWWTGLFFNLSKAAAGVGFVRPWAWLLAVPVAALAVSTGRPRAVLGRLPRWPAWATALAALGSALAAVAVLSALLTWWAPADVARLHAPAWLTDSKPFPAGLSGAPSGALWAIIVMSMWGVGQMAIIYLAKLQDVPEELYEASQIDGANWWQKVRHITLPMISPVILFNVVMAIIGTFQIFAEPYIMTRGGPEYKTRFLAMFIYDQAFQYQRVGYASAIAWVLFLIIVTLTVAAFAISRKRVYYAGR